MNSPLDHKRTERNTLKLMLQSTEFLTYINGPLQMIFKTYQRSEFIQSKEIETIMRWVLEYFSKYQKAPYFDIESIVWRECDKIKRNDPVQVELLEALVQSICDEIEDEEIEYNAKAQWDITKEYFNIRRAAILAKELQHAVESIDTEYIGEAMQRFSTTEASTSKITSILQDEDLVDRAFAQKSDPILKLPGALGELLNRHMVPGGFISFLGAEKRGKSWMLLYLQMMAAAQRIPTLQFHCGDMTEEDVAARVGVYLTRRSNDEDYCGELAIPMLDCAKSQSGECTGKGLVWPGQNNPGERKSRNKDKSESEPEAIWDIESIKTVLRDNPTYEPCTECRRNGNREYRGAVYWKLRKPVDPLTAHDQKQAYKEFIQRHKLSEASYPLMAEYPTFGLSITELKAILEERRNAGKLPKIVFIDYADLLEQESKDPRLSAHTVWGALRGIASEFGILIITVTQTNKEGLITQLLDETNFSESKTKNAHVTALFGLNQTPKEKEMGILRINTILARGAKFNKRRAVAVLQCLEIGQPIMGSYWA